MSATTVTTGGQRSGQDLAYALQTASFDPAKINDHLHVVGVGPFSYADSPPQGSVDTAQVNVEASATGERVSGVYDVFVDGANARRDYDTADADFRKSAGYAAVTLSPSTPAFCGRQADGSAECWFVYRVTTANVGVSGGTAEATTADGKAVMQAMLKHLVALGA